MIFNIDEYTRSDHNYDNVANLIVGVGYPYRFTAEIHVFCLDPFSYTFIERNQNYEHSLDSPVLFGIFSIQTAKRNILI